MKTKVKTLATVRKVCKCERHDEYKRFRIDVRGPGEDWHVYWDYFAPCGDVALWFMRRERQPGCEYRAVQEDAPSLFGMNP